MTFSSPGFIYLFLPITVLVWWQLHPKNEALAQWFVIGSSLIFYGFWNIENLPILMGICLFNYSVACWIRCHPSRWIIFAALAIDLSLLGFYKYAAFLAESLSGFIDIPIEPFKPVSLPLGISFFTFQVIAYVADTYKGKVRDASFRRFFFSITFFPHLIAGPILHYSDVMPQLKDCSRFSHQTFVQGLYLFCFGLFKKVFIADRLGGLADRLFAFTDPIGLYDAWIASVSYSLQIYFDFSGYSDMAIGIGLLFGIRLPLNFNSPYQAESITDFWRRWHMTLSRFLRNYIYIPLGGNRIGFFYSFLAAFFTMALGGLWHGAAWTFVLWGAFHGFFIGINRLWSRTGVCLPRWLNKLLTYIAVVFSWVLFRADSVDTALSLWRGMLGLNGVSLPALFSGHCATCYTGTLTGLESFFLMGLLALCMTYKNSQQWVADLSGTNKELIFASAMLLLSIWSPGAHEHFIYWQF